MGLIDEITREIMMDPENAVYTQKGIKPLFTAPKNARIVIVGQAPGLKAQESGLFWNDPSGDTLRDWMGVDRDTFYESDDFAVLPMDFYFPGKGKSGDLPPRKDFAQKWHGRILQELPDVQLTILIGSYAQRYYLKQPSTAKLTETVRDFKRYLPNYFPLVHPSPRNNIWQKKNPWFKEEVLPVFKREITRIIK